MGSEMCIRDRARGSKSQGHAGEDPGGTSGGSFSPNGGELARMEGDGLHSCDGQMIHDGGDSGGIGVFGGGGGVIGLCPVGDEPRLREQLSRARAQLHAARLENSRFGGELRTAQHRLREVEAEARDREARVAALEAELQAAGGDPSRQVTSRLVELAEARLDEMAEALTQKEAELARVQAASWGAWAQDAAVHAELGRLQDELSQSHVEVTRLGRILSETQEAAERDARAAAEGIVAERAARHMAEAAVVELKSVEDTLRSDLSEAIEALEVRGTSRSLRVRPQHQIPRDGVWARRKLVALLSNTVAIGHTGPAHQISFK